MPPLSSKMVSLSSKMAHRGFKKWWVAPGSLVGQWVARGSLILALVREIRGSLTHTVLSIYYYTPIRCGRRPAPTRAGVSKKIVLGVYGGEGGFEMLIPQTEKLSVRHSSTLKLLGRLEGTAKPRKQRSENS